MQCAFGGGGQTDGGGGGWVRLLSPWPLTSWTAVSAFLCSRTMTRLCTLRKQFEGYHALLVPTVNSRLHLTHAHLLHRTACRMKFLPQSNHLPLRLLASSSTAVISCSTPFAALQGLQDLMEPMASDQLDAPGDSATSGPLGPPGSGQVSSPFSAVSSPPAAGHPQQMRSGSPQGSPITSLRAPSFGASPAPAGHGALHCDRSCQMGY